MNKSQVQKDQNSLPVSINDIRDKYFDDIPLTEEERTALVNYDRFRMDYLNSASTEDEFEKRYLELQVKANLSPYTDFLDSSNLKVD